MALLRVLTLDTPKRIGDAPTPGFVTHEPGRAICRSTSKAGDEMELLEILDQLVHAISVRQLIAAIQADPDRLTLGLYPVTIALLVAGRRSRRLSLVLSVAVALLRVLSVIVLFALSILLAIARSEGRSHYRW
jgi:hypothetical protein